MKIYDIKSTEFCICNKQKYAVLSMSVQMYIIKNKTSNFTGARCSSVVRAFAHGVMGRWIDPSWGGPIELFLVPASAPQLV